MVTPVILTWLYCATVVLSIIGVIFTMTVAGAAVGAGWAVLAFFGSLIVAAIIQIPIRMYFEILILFFIMKDELTDIRKNLKQ